MKKLLLLMIVLAPFMGYSIDKHKINKPMPKSRWREISRLKPDSSEVLPFTDTLFISFMLRDSFIYHNGNNGFIYRGGYTISEDSILDFGTVRYKIRVRKPLQLVLANDAGVYNMERDSSDTAKVVVLAKEEKLLPVTDIDQMIGHWTVYKKASKDSSSFGSIDNSIAIRSVYITGPSTDGKQGFVFSGTDPSNMPSWYIKSLGTDQVLDCDGKNKRILKVIKCQKGEMILEDQGVRYYFKQFK